MWNRPMLIPDASVSSVTMLASKPASSMASRIVVSWRKQSHFIFPNIIESETQQGGSIKQTAKALTTRK
jgi:hypothetical protein